MTEAENIKHMRKGKISWRLLGENFVFQDGDSYYKMPTFLARNTMYRNTGSFQKVNQSIEIIKKYFWPLTKIPKTEVFCDETCHYVIKQEKIEGEKLTRKMLEENPQLLSKFKRLIIANELMWKKEGVFLDLLGSDIVSHPQTIHNLLSDGKDIYVFDFWLLESKSKNIFFRYFSHFGQKIQLYFIRLFF